MRSKILVMTVAVFSLLYFGSPNESLAGKLREKQIKQDKSPQGSTQPGLSGKKLYTQKMCHTCHGAEGRKGLMPTYPTIDGQKYDYLLRQMLDIKSGERSNGMSAAMKAITANVSEAEIRAIADYLSRLTPKKEDKKPAAAVSVGKKLYQEKICHSCHGLKAQNPIAGNYPRLAGQNEQYLANQMIDMKDKKRLNGMSNAMTPFLGMCSKEDLKKISKYIASLNR